MASTKSNNNLKQNNVSHSEEEEKPIIPKEIDQSQYIPVRNGFQGKLIYKTRSGEKYVWDTFGAEQDIELRELKNAKSAHKKMFENNWFMFDDENQWVIDYLGVRKFYSTGISIDNFDDLFSKSPSEIKKAISNMSDGLKKSVSYRARQMVIDGIIDSRKVISALEESLQSELIEK